MQCDLRQNSPTGSTVGGLTMASLPCDPDPHEWTQILPSWRAAFPPDHPDHFPGDDDAAIAFLMRLVDGSELGPLHRSTTLLVDEAGRAVAGVVVNLRPQDPPWGGAWIADIWRDPALRGTGLGTTLIDHVKSLLLEDGHAKLTLAVTSGNDARRSYERAGFRVVVESQTLRLPTYRRPAR
jgi:ribosomal protein S18 acetylase RimI-like enzyme